MPAQCVTEPLDFQVRAPHVALGDRCKPAIDQAHRKTIASAPAIESSDNNQLTKIKNTSLHSQPIYIAYDKAELATLIAQEQNN